MKLKKKINYIKGSKIQKKNYNEKNDDQNWNKKTKLDDNYNCFIKCEI